MHKKWLEMGAEIVDSIKANRALKLCCPYCREMKIDYQFVGDAVLRVGYLCIWCMQCKRGIHLSRVTIPENANLISYDESIDVISKRIPNFRG